MKLSVFLPSHNKGGFAVEAARSVFMQSHQDWELHILENSTDGRTRNILRKFTDLDDPRVRYHEIEVPAEVRQQHAPCPWLLNQWYPRAEGDIILYLSDDDLFMPGIFANVVRYFEDNPGHEALYFTMGRTIAGNPGEGMDWSARWMTIPAEVPRNAGQVDCIIDGGQAAYRKHVLDLIGQPYFYDGNDPAAACHCDGMHLESLAQAGVTFHPLQVNGLIHRHTQVSTWSKAFG